MKKLLDDVKQFHEACDVPVLDKPQILPQERAALRIHLIDEEFKEFIHAVQTNDLVEVADALADIVYVTVGAALEFGIPLDKVWDEVQKSNMAKVNSVTGKVIRRADGKILKPVNWKPPEIKKALSL